MSTEHTSSILIVDDTPINIKVLAEALNREYYLRVATSGPKCLELAASAQPPDLILLDVMMPGMDGYEVCRRLKADATTSGIPVIFVTARDEAEDERRGLELGAVDYITKPFNLPIVQARVRTHLKLKMQADLLEQYAFLDSLTHLANRRCFNRDLDQEWRRARRVGLPLGLCLIDIDDFKAYNDNLGHSAGDTCLRRVAKAIKASACRAGDLAARYGGEEFVVLLPAADLEASRVVSEHLRAAVEALQLPHPDSRGGPLVTISVGYASCQPSATFDNPQNLIDAADRALYGAKEAGRNRVEGSDPGSGS